MRSLAPALRQGSASQLGVKPCEAQVEKPAADTQGAGVLPEEVAKEEVWWQGMNSTAIDPVIAGSPHGRLRLRLGKPAGRVWLSKASDSGPILDHSQLMGGLLLLPELCWKSGRQSAVHGPVMLE
ncbi:hypothetical protein HaLaN_06621 [Haematococcus lacustris]|uniref:Uncharacterized protein n=1 Tax=Haematococcus lacustris TaxID=44745 RepID=A0A699YLK2_HAELA|nr:hypothetical protein HaLaN_06621 [Haematococcus lacustris]